VFLTSVTKFSHINVLSDLNHLIDLTFDPDYADISKKARTTIRHLIFHDVQVKMPF